ncbi:MAG: hypothetical protein IJK14_01455 [Clostridia bacterium]|nr:hypothetical protein [Clostridia bacterium]
MKFDPSNLNSADWSSLSYGEKNLLLFFRQKKTLDLFLQKSAISKAQYDKSLHDLIEKTGVRPDEADR